MLVLTEVHQIVGHRFVDPDELEQRDPVALREELTTAGHRAELLIRGRFKAAGRPRDPGEITMRWVVEGEVVQQVGNRISALVNMYTRALVHGLTAALGAALGAPSPAAGAPAPAVGGAGAGGAGADGAAAPGVAAVAPDDDDDDDDYDGIGIAAAAAERVALVEAMVAYIEATSCTLKSVYSTFAHGPGGGVAASEFSIWLGRTDGRISAAKSVRINREVQAFLAKAGEPIGAGAGPPGARAGETDEAAAAVLGAMATGGEEVRAAAPAAAPRARAPRARAAAGSADEGHGDGPVWRGALPYAVPNERAAARVLQAAHAEAGAFAMRVTETRPLPPMPREGGFCHCGVRWIPGSEHFDPTNQLNPDLDPHTNQLNPDLDPQCGPCFGWLCMRIRAAGGPVGDRAKPTLPSEPYE